MINKYFEGDFYQKTEKQKTIWNDFMWRLYHAELVRNFSDRTEVKDALSCMSDEVIEVFSCDKKFEKYMFKKLVEKPFEELEMMVKNREQQEFRIPAVETMLMKAYVLHLYKNELGFSDIHTVPTKEFVKEHCEKKCELFKLENNKCIEAKYIDKLFRYKKSIKEINKEYGWLALYQKYISIIKSCDLVNVNLDVSWLHGKKRIRIYSVSC